MRSRVAIVAVASFLALAVIPAPAGRATPVGAVCDVPPRAWEEVAALAALPPPATPVPSGLLPRGEQLRVDQLLMIETTVHQFIACANAGEPLRVFALYTDDYLRRLVAYERPAFDRARYDALATPAPAAPGDGAALVKITGGRWIPDGRLGALVTIAYPATPEPKTFFFTFRLIGDRLLIDDILGELTFSLP